MSKVLQRMSQGKGLIEYEQDTVSAETATDVGRNELIFPVEQVVKNSIPDNIEVTNELVDVEAWTELDGLYGWIVVAASFLCCFMVGTMFIAFSILYLEFVDYFNAERGATGWIGSLYLATGNICGVCMSMVIEYRGCRFLILLGSIIWMFSFASSALATSIPYLYLTYGIFGGLGFNMVTLSSFVIVQKHFQKYRSIAAGLSASGISIGSLTSGPLIGFFISIYGWRGTLLLMSGMAFNCCVFGCFYRPPRLLKTMHNFPRDEINIMKRIAVQDEKQNNATVGLQMRNLLKGLVSIFENPRFLAICMSTFFFNFGASIFYQHTPSRAVSLGVDRKSAYFIQSIVGMMTLAARIIGASIGNAKCTDRILQYGLSVVASGVCLSATGFASFYQAICLVAGSTGFSTGLVMTIQTTVLTDIVGVCKVHRAQAFLLVFMGIGALIGVPFAGIIYDKTKNYNLPFYIGGGMQIFGGLTMAAIHIILKTRSTSKVPITA